jgi:RND family efflux transporter MFP subunit
MKFSFFLSTLLIVLTIGSVACNSERNSTSTTPEVVRGTATVKAVIARVPDEVPAPGTVHAAQSSQLAAQVMGVVTSMNVREGDAVKQGQVLAVIDASQEQAALDRAQALLAAAQHDLVAAQSDRNLSETTLKRFTTLSERKSVSPQEYDEVKARYTGAASRADAAQASEAQARAAVAQAQSAFGYTRIRAPFDGIVTARKIDPGAMAVPGAPIVTIETRSKFRAEVSVDESDLRYVREGQDVPLRLDAYPDQPITARVVQIVPAADAQSRTFLVKLEMPKLTNLRSGLSVTAFFPRGTRESLFVPTSAVVNRGALRGVYVLDQNQVASLRYVTVGSASEGRLEVLSGLTANESVVAAPSDRELAGKRIEVQQ